MEKLEKRMYSLVIYQLSGIQAGIQSAHSNIEYSLEYGNDSDYIDWAKNHKTVILLNGGTSNNGKESYYGYDSSKGTMENHLQTLRNIGVKVSPFYEPDLNYCLTSMSFVVDERVFNKNKYPNFDYANYPYIYEINSFEEIPILEEYLNDKNLFINFKDDFADWLDSIGGINNYKLRLFLDKFRLANN